jgi:hypothetical protein
MIALHGSYAPKDVTFLVTPMTMATTSVAAKEKLIQSGKRHYSEMLSAESPPTPAYMATYEAAMAANALRLARHVNTLADALAARHRANGRVALASLLRAGTPIGVLLGRALRRRGLQAVHVSISIIRGRGIDLVALHHLLGDFASQDIVFVDGWTGKGAIATELRGPAGAAAAGIDPFLVVVADPAGVADLAATAADYVIPSGILGGIVSGLFSRSVLNERIGPGSFHGAVLLHDLAPHDVSRSFVDRIDTLAQIASPQADIRWSMAGRAAQAARSTALLAEIAVSHGVDDRNRIKPGIAEATRAVLRRMPHRLLLADAAEAEVQHLVLLAQERCVPIAPLPEGGPYRAVAIIARAEE